MPRKEWTDAHPEQNAARHRTWYEANKERERAKAVERQRKLRAINIPIMRAAKDRPCADCKLEWPYYVMHFDHLGHEAKVENVSKMASWPTARLLAEIAKCEVVCANCHAIRTHTRLQLKTQAAGS